jgi:hypothetical protein
MIPRKWHDLAAWDAAVLDAKRLVARAQKCQFYQFADGFDNYNSASLLYELVNGSISFSSAYARFPPPAGLPGQGISISTGGAYIRKNLQSNQATLIIKIAFKPANYGGSSGAGNPFLAVLDAGTAQCYFQLLPSGAVTVYSSAMVAETGPGVIALGQYYGIEIEITIGSSTGAVQIWVNGFQVLTATGLNTQRSSNAYANQVAIGDIADNNLSGYFDDFRVWDSTGSSQNAPLGTDSRVVTKLPSGAGSTTQWTPNGAAANWQCVDDNPPDGDTTYVSSSTIDNVDTYAMPTAGFTAAPVTVVSRIYARKDDGATRAEEIGVQSSGSALSGGNPTLGSTYAFYDGNCSVEDPHTLAPWTAAGADAAEFWMMETA